MYFTLDNKLIIVQIAVISSHTEIMSHILAAQTLFTSHQCLEQLLTVASTDNICTCITKQLLNSLCQITNGRSIRLLNKQITRIAMLESKHNQINCLIQIHQKASHVGISDGNRISCLDLIDEQRNNTATAAHNIAITGATDSRTTTFGSDTSIGINNMLHHSLRNAHCINRISCLIR